jgi:hypothetical protein
LFRIVLISLGLALVFSLGAISHAPASPGCKAELVNLTHDTLDVQVTYDDGHKAGFTIAQDATRDVDLFYSGSCHAGARVLAHYRKSGSVFSSRVHQGQVVKIT